MKCRLGLVLVFVLMAFALAATGASASTATFTKAVATTDWRHGSFAGSVNYTDCNLYCNYWLILIEDQPATEPCYVPEWAEPEPKPDPKVNQVWSSVKQEGNGTIAFDVSEAALLPGVYEQRLCLISAQTYTEFPDHGPAMQQVLATVDLTVKQPTVTGPSPAAPSGRCILARKEVKRLKKKLSGLVKRHASHKSILQARTALRKARIRRAARC